MVYLDLIGYHSPNTVQVGDGIAGVQLSHLLGIDIVKAHFMESFRTAIAAILHSKRRDEKRI
jgi:hypothetical protein